MIDRIVPLSPGVWYHELTALRIRLPEGRRTYGVHRVNDDGREVSATRRRFRTLEAAHAWCSQQIGA